MSRRGQRYAVSHGVTFLPALVIPAGGWQYLHEPMHWAGLGVMMAAGLIVIPAGILAVLFFVPALLRGGLVPSDWRKRYRRRLADRGVPRNGQRSAYISKGLRRVVIAADRYRCVACHAQLYVHVDHLEIDHTFPWSLGGLTNLWNCMTLCKTCNLVKSNYWRYRRSGNAVYVAWQGHANAERAAAILACEMRHRWNPLRLIRAAWALG